MGFDQMDGVVRPSPQPHPPGATWRFETFDADAFALSDGGATITATTGMLAEERYALGNLLTSGRHEWEFVVNQTRYPDAHIFLGVCDATCGDGKGATWSYSPPTGSLYIGTEPNEHGEEQMKKEDKIHGHEFGRDENGFAGHVCRVIADLDARTLAFKIDDHDPVQIRPSLPPAVRVWAFIYHEGDSLTIREPEGITPHQSPAPVAAAAEFKE